MKTQKEINNHYWQSQWEEQRNLTEQLLACLKLAYRKHHMDDQKIGWEELSNKMRDTLCDVMGDKEFIKFLDSGKPVFINHPPPKMWSTQND